MKLSKKIYEHLFVFDPTSNSIPNEHIFHDVTLPE